MVHGRLVATLRIADVPSLLQTPGGRVEEIAAIALFLKVFQNVDPNPAVPIEFIPVVQSFEIRLEFFIRRVVIKSHVPW